ncbi:MAG: metallophosphoesterase, partial [Pseudomonadota bacterium]
MSVVGVVYLFALFGCTYPSGSELEPPSDVWRYSGVERIVAVSDIHGAFDPMVATFQAASVIDDNLSWVGGETHLVIAGDILDRGSESRRSMDLLMALEKQAKLAGGKVHVLLGNHEVMNLIGDLRYVAKGEFSAFSEQERATDRAHWYQHFVEREASRHGEEQMQQLFNAIAPPGFFGHREAFRADGRYGKWLIHKPMLVVIGDTAFVHGGLPPLVTKYGLKKTNQSLHSDLHEFLAARFALEQQEVISPIDEFRDLPELLAEQLESDALGEGVTDDAGTVIRLRDSPLNRSTGPLWYRGNASCNGEPMGEGEALDRALAVLGVSRVVIGHTTTASR